MKTVNAVITSTSLGIQDHGIMTFWLTCEWSGAGQGLGGYGLDQYDKLTEDRIGWGPSIIAIRKILEVVGVEKWEDLKGQLVRLKVDGWPSSRTPILGNILEDKWFDLKEFMVLSTKRDRI